MINPRQAPALGLNPPNHAVPCGWCHKCLEGVMSPDMPQFPVTATMFIVCAICGNKRCPHGTDCSLPCSGSNLTGQKGSLYE